MASSPRPLPPAEVEERLRAQFGDDVLEFQDSFGHAVATVNVSRSHEILSFLRDEPDLDCDYYDFGGAVDFEAEGMEMIHHVVSTRHNHNIRIKVKLPAEDPHCPTMSDVYAGANWHEREAAEMFGIVFDGHPQPVKLLLSEEFEGHPLRKDFPLMSREAKPWPGDSEIED